ncbi:MAG: VOC family protein ['Candidatus Kapabacteria' thiocyanatum]|uniref:Extradiol dioxygenase n=1 Tax=Candidatus Kapaibacterium thiocyanatum TaxID=1895771 RepID=A0A1M3L6I7_9BACT|nr:VOC family protein ['Candidatus Kapabacteria' thiocyanatum]OJX61177.1 MAG: extradiol dioxygenase ['Candidatus Kapabacteria' thiocyanatum]
MARQMFVNLPVKNLDKSVEFFTKLGFTFNPQYTDENATCMIVGESSFVMLLMEPFFRTFITKDICDTSRQVEVITAISSNDRADVDDMVTKAIAAGGGTPREALDYGFMYNRAFTDLDGHIWEVFWMDPNGMP